MTAHHAVLVVNVTEVEQAPEGAMPPTARRRAAVLRHLREIHDELDARPPTGAVPRSAAPLTPKAMRCMRSGSSTCADRARSTTCSTPSLNAVRPRLKPDERAHRQVLDELNEKLVDKYFVNFSVFESMPDVWAIDQVFPIVPIDAPRRSADAARRDRRSHLRFRRPHRQYVDADGVDVSLPLHALRDGEPYRLGIFMVGAYQETLGDIHNLFGDTDAVNVRVDATAATSSPTCSRGDTTDVMLDYVGYDLDALRAAYRDKIARRARRRRGGADRGDARSGPDRYTYLAESR